MGIFTRLADFLANGDDLEDSLRRLDSQTGRYLTPGSLEVLDGGTPVGSITDIQTMFDGNIYLLPETSGTPGFDLKVLFSSVNNISAIVTRAYYSPGSSGHYGELRIHNYDTTNDDPVINLPPADDYNVRTVFIPESKNYIENGIVEFHFYHPGGGNPAHDLFVDYLGIVN